MEVPRSVAQPAAILAVLLATGGLLAGCGSPSSPASHPGPTVTVTVTAAPTPTATTAPPNPGGSPGCTTSALAVSLGPGNGAAGSTYFPIKFTNVSSAACTLYGYPGVSFATASGGQVGTAATEDPAYPRRLVTLAAGTTAHAEVRVTNAMNYPASTCQPVAVHRLRVFAPGQTTARFATLNVTACTSTSVQLLSVQTIQPGNGLAGYGRQ